MLTVKEVDEILGIILGNEGTRQNFMYMSMARTAIASDLKGFEERMKKLKEYLSTKNLEASQ